MFSPDVLKANGNGMVFVYLLFGLACIVLIVILLNLLIAIISDTYDRVASEQ